MDLFAFDGHYRSKGYETIAGVDEAGRGPWAGPVVAAAVILPSSLTIDGLNDSKKLTPLRRDKLFDKINSAAIAVGVGIVGPGVIDDVNILQATYRAMREALGAVTLPVDMVLVDGCWPIPELSMRQQAVIGGDGKSAAVAAASIIAKVTRDRIMAQAARAYPEYRFDDHKGYGTKAHREALEEHGPCAIHRKSFEPIRALMEQYKIQG